MKYKIYILRDPISNLIRYVGQTSKSLNRRLSCHINRKEKNYKYSWIKSLKKKNTVPKIELIETLDNIEDCNKAEIFYIDIFKKIGYKLTNHSIGGSGNKGYKMLEKNKRKLSNLNKGKILSEEHKEKIGLANKGRISLKTIEASKKYWKNRKRDCNCKSILKFNINGEFIKEYKSARDASKETGISYKIISQICIRQTKNPKKINFIFRFK